MAVAVQKGQLTRVPGNWVPVIRSWFSRFGLGSAVKLKGPAMLPVTVQPQLARQAVGVDCGR
jgi:hypothetical protein